MPKGIMNQAGVPKPSSPSKPQVKNRSNIPRKPKLEKVGDSSMSVNQKGMAAMKPKLLKSNKGGIPRPKMMKSKRPKIPKLNLPDPVS